MIISFGKCAHGGCPENSRIENKRTKWVCPCNISYDMQKEGEDMTRLNRVVAGDELWVHHYQPESKACFNAMETSQLTSNQKV
jgi:hypothetical protein